MNLNQWMEYAKVQDQGHTNANASVTPDGYIAVSISTVAKQISHTKRQNLTEVWSFTEVGSGFELMLWRNITDGSDNIRLSLTNLMTAFLEAPAGLLRFRLSMWYDVDRCYWFGMSALRITILLLSWWWCLLLLIRWRFHLTFHASVGRCHGRFPVYLNAWKQCN